MQACPRLTKPTAKAGSSSVTLRNSVTAMSKCRSLSALRPASRCCTASGEDVCNASHRMRTVLITASPVPVFPEIDLLKHHQALDVLLKARIRQSWRTWRHPDRSATACRSRIHSFPQWWRSEFVHSPARERPGHHDYCVCLAT